MLWTIALMLLSLWALGLIKGLALGGPLHLLFVLALVTVVIQPVTGRRVA